MSRKALHAGSWYSSDGIQLKSELEKWLSSANTAHSPARAIIAPHAGYSYCGACGGFAYKQIDPTLIKKVFILGPLHHVYMARCALSSASVYQTPLYNLKIDQEVYAELGETGKFDIMDLTTDEEEHSIEMQLPYIASVMESKRDSYTIIPVLVGAIKPHQEQEYGKIFAPYLSNPENLFVISSDFCHWGKRFHFTSYDKSRGPIHSSIEALDKAGMNCIASLDAEAFSQYLDQTHNTICGRHPIAVLLNFEVCVYHNNIRSDEQVDCEYCGAAIVALEQDQLQAIGYLQASRPELSCALKFVQYAQSSRCKSMSDSSVSYGSASLTVHSPGSVV